MEFLKLYNNARKNNDNKKIYIPYNDNIRSDQVRCIDADGSNIGVISRDQGIDLAFSKSMDLIQISDGKDGIPVCKIADFVKFKFEYIKKQKETAKKQRESVIKIKEIKFRPATDRNDLKIKAAKALEFLEEGDKVKVSLFFKGREMARKEIGFETFKEFISYIPSAAVTSPPTFQGKCLIAIIEKKKDQ